MQTTTTGRPDRQGTTDMNRPTESGDPCQAGDGQYGKAAVASSTAAPAPAPATATTTSTAKVTPVASVDKTANAAADAGALRRLPPLHRRQWLALLAAAGWGASQGPAYAAAVAAVAATAAPREAGAMTAASAAPRFASAWEAADGYRVGVLSPHGQALQVSSALEVPTRAHGVWVEPAGTLLAVARRPGDWLLRWQPQPGGGGQAVAWGWIEPDRAFNGHVIASADGRTLYTTETDLETGEGLIGLRDAATLEKTGEWSTHGMDPHELLLDADGTLVVANGGIPALPETGRLKIQLHRMDASLVRLDTRTGALLGQWRVADRRLSLRHIAWGPAIAGGAGRRLLGIALQGEHEDAAARRAAPVLAIFDGQSLQVCEADAAIPLQGYGGDIAWAAGGFAVGCPRANGVAVWRADGRWAGFVPLEEACAVTALPAVAAQAGTGVSGTASPQLWAGGRIAAVQRDAAGHMTSRAIGQDVRLDNHWSPLG